MITAEIENGFVQPSVKARESPTEVDAVDVVVNSKAWQILHQLGRFNPFWFLWSTVSLNPSPQNATNTWEGS